MKRLLLAAALFLAAAAPPPPMHVDPSWPQPLPHGWVLGEVSGVATDQQNHVWIIQRPVADKQHAAPPVIEFDPDGRVVQAWGGPWRGEGPRYDWFTSEHGVYVDHKGFVWLGGNGMADGQVLKFTRDGKFVLQIGHPGARIDSNDVTKLGRPADTRLDPAANEIYIADGYGNHRIIVFDADTGAYKRHWGAYGLRRPTTIWPTTRRPRRRASSAIRCIASSCRATVWYMSVTARTTASRCSATTAALLPSG